MTKPGLFLSIGIFLVILREKTNVQLNCINKGEKNIVNY